MSMLAEKRQKKLLLLQPRGKPLYEDANSFGAKMLEKMGWSKGKGLGANEDGNPEFVRIKYKNDNVGLGYEDRNDRWTKHEDDFDDFLKSLSNSVQNSDTEEQDCCVPAIGIGIQKENPINGSIIHKLSGESLEEKSKNSRARVHYKKFTRGKDVSQYSEKDLANIFGKKSFNTAASGDLQEKQEKEIEANGRDSEICHSFGVTTISAGTPITDYFKNKVQFMNSSRKLAGTPTIGNKCQKTSEQHTENILLNSSSSNGIATHLEGNSNKSKSKLRTECKNECENDDSTKEHCSVSLDESQVVVTDEIPKKRKKKKREVEDLEGNSINLQGTMKTEEILNIKEDSAEQFIKRKSKKRKENEVTIKEEESSSNQSLEGNLQQVKKRKRKEDRNNLQSEDIVCSVESSTEQNVHKLKQESPLKKDKNDTQNSSNEYDIKTIEDQGKTDARSTDMRNCMEVLQDTPVECENEKLRRRHKKTRSVDGENDSPNCSKTIKGENNPTQHEQVENIINQNCEVSQQLGDEIRAEHNVKMNKHKKQTSSVENHVHVIEISNRIEEGTIECNTKKVKRKKSKEIKDVFDIENNTTQKSQECNNRQKEENNEQKGVGNHVENVKISSPTEGGPIERSTKKIKREKSKEMKDVSDTEKNTTQESQECNKPQKEESKGKMGEFQVQSCNSAEVCLQNNAANDNFIYELNAYGAEIFRYLDVNGFVESNFGDIIGYGLPENISVEVVFRKNNEEKIAQMWSDVINKRKELQANGGLNKKKKINYRRLKKRKVFKL